MYLFSDPDSRETAFRDLCIEIALGNVGGEKFNRLLLETGICLDDYEWEQANRLLVKSEEMFSLVDKTPALC